jgi:hypothetical protein
MAKEIIIKNLIFSFKPYCIYFLLICFTFTFSGCSPVETGNQPLSKTPENQESNVQLTCDSSDLTSYIHAQQIGNIIEGTMVISNYSNQICVINPPFTFALHSSNGQLITNSIFDHPPVSISKNGFLEIMFSWTNECDSLETEFFFLTFESKGMVGRINQQLEDPNGNYFLSVPACNDENLNPQLTIKNFRSQLDQ